MGGSCWRGAHSREDPGKLGVRGAPRAERAAISPRFRCEERLGILLGIGEDSAQNAEIVHLRVADEAGRLRPAAQPEPCA